MKRAMLFLLGTVATLTACQSDDGIGPEPGLDPPAGVDAVYQWLFEGWSGTQPIGDPAVVVSWDLPAAWDGEPFRVYARRSGQGSYFLVATVTSCAESSCLYTDANVASGVDYDYYVTSADERFGRESSPSNVARVSVPAFRAPPAPAPGGITALNSALLIRWQDAGLGDDLWKYQVWLVAVNDSSGFYYKVGETDGTGFLDLRTSNGNEYTYRIAAVDVDGHVSPLSVEMTGVPRASAPSLGVWGTADGLRSDGIVAADGRDPLIEAGPNHVAWQVEIENGGYVLRPRASASGARAPN